ncbi:MAG: rhomboid family intramembrane serine protease [Acidimicrobiales bacterium]
MPVPTALIPIHDQNPTRSFSYLTVALIAINVALLLAEPSLGMGDSPQLSTFFCRWGMIPWEVTHGEPATGFGECAGAGISGKGVYTALFTSMFLHGGIVHLLGNMLFLWVFGNNIEDTLGRVRFLLFYLITGLGASLAHVLVNPGSTIPTVGASGAISGLLGAYLILFPRARIVSILPLWFFIRVIELPAVVVLGLWFVLQFVIGVGQQVGGAGVAWMAHVGGFLAGMGLILALGGRRLIRSAYP